MGPGDRIRATFNQTVARTGGSAPMLRTSTTSRSAPRPGVPSGGPSCRSTAARLLVADYNQIELRVIAHLADDPGLVAAFEAGDDIHTAVAAADMGYRPVRGDLRGAEPGQDGRLRAGLRHGGLRAVPAPRLIGRGGGNEILESYFAAFPSVRAYMERTVDRGPSEGLHGDPFRASPTHT